MKPKLLLLILFCPVVFFQGHAQLVSSLEFCTAKASFNSPTDVFMDRSDQLFIVDQTNHALRLLNTVGYTSTVAGNGQPGSSSTLNAASLGAPSHVAKDKIGNLYITTEFGASGVRKIDPQGNISTFASSGIGTYTDGQGSSSWFTKPSGIVYDSIHNVLYVADSWAHKIHRIGMDGVVQTLAGSTRGFANATTGSAALFNYPEGLTVDADGNVYVADSGNHLIRKITPEGSVSTYAGSTQGFTNGSYESSQFNYPVGVAFDKTGTLYVTDRLNYAIRAISASREVSTFSGNGNMGYKDDRSTLAEYGILNGITVDALGNVIVADMSNNAIRMVTPYNYNEVLTLAGSATSGFVNGCQQLPLIDQPLDLVVDANGNTFYADFMQNRIMKIDAAGTLSVFAGRKLRGKKDGSAEQALFNGPVNLAIDAQGTLYVTEQGNHCVRKITSAGVVTTLAGTGTYGYVDGNALDAKFNFPTGIAVDASGDVWVTDNSTKIRKISNGIVSTFAGNAGPGYQDGPLATAKFLLLNDIIVHLDGSISVLSNHSLRKITNGEVSTIIGNGNSGFADGNGTEGRMDLTFGFAGYPGGYYAIADSRNHAIRAVDNENNLYTVAGNGTAGYEEGTLGESQLSFPTGVAIHPGGYLLVTDSENKVIRKIEVDLTITSTQDQHSTLEEINLFPVPNNGQFTIDHKASILQVDLISTTGQTETHYTRDITTTMKGLLLVRIVTAQGVSTKKILVK